MDSSTNTRNTNLEIARIVSAVFIILSHFAIHGKLSFNDNTPFLNIAFIYFISSLGKIGVNIFVLISGYFLINSKFRLSKVIKLYLTIFTYSIIIAIILKLTGYEESIIYGLLPISLNLWWFATAYFILYLLTPLINIFLNYISKRAFKTILIVLFIILSVFPTVLIGNKFNVPNLLLLLEIYCIGAYIAKYGLRIEKLNTEKIILLFITFSVINYILTIIALFDIIKTGDPLFFCGQNKVFVVIISVLLFLYFKKLEVKHSSIINTTAATTFGIYLIHDHPFLRNIIWNTVFKNQLYVNSPYLSLIALTKVAAVFVVCALIEYLRIKYIEQIYMKHVYILDKFI